MPILSDQHLHSSFSGDSDAPMETMIRSALDKGLKSMTFTEHLDYDFPLKYNLSEGYFEVDEQAYHDTLQSFREVYKDRIRLLFGIEMGLKPEVCVQNAQFLKRQSYDFVIGSVHLVNNEDPYYPEYYNGRSERAAMEEYFRCILTNMDAFMDFDVLGHMDYIVRYTPSKGAFYSPADYTDLTDEILKRIISAGKGIELNTGAFLKGMSEPNPHRDLIKRYRELGGEIITVGSDAHKPKDIANGFDRASDILKACGFSYYCRFEGRTPVRIKL